MKENDEQKNNKWFHNAVKWAQRQRFSILKFISNTLGMIQLACYTHPFAFISIFLLEVIQALIPIASAWLIKLMFDLLVQGIQVGGSVILKQQLIILLVSQVLLTVLDQLLTKINSYLNNELGRRLTLNIQMKIYSKINSLMGLAPFEAPHFQDMIQLAVHGAQLGPKQTIAVFTTLLRSSITLMTFFGILVSVNPLLAVVLGLAALPQLVVQVKMGKQRFGVSYQNSPTERKAMYYNYVLSALPFAKEVRLFNTSNYFLQGFRKVQYDLFKTQRKQQLYEMRWQTGLGIISSSVYGFALAIIMFQALNTRASLGDITLYLSATMNVQASLISIIQSFSTLYENALFYTHFTNLLALPESLTPSTTHQSVPELKSCIELRNISFRYNEQSPWILSDLNLVIPAHRCLALVGPNGVGKTTLVKLLTRLYDPTIGEILWDGIDIRNFDIQELRWHISTIGQDFAHYELTANENIGLGDIRHIDNVQRIQDSSIRAGIHDTIKHLPQGYQTVLSKWLTDGGAGAELSGGEWQKIAMARMFMREANLLILDEPTSSLDAEAEHDLYCQLLDLWTGKTGVLITHRFSTARMADLIAVMKDGTICEYGSHDELMKIDKTYAKLYRLQAKSYEEHHKSG